MNLLTIRQPWSPQGLWSSSKRLVGSINFNSSGYIGCEFVPVSPQARPVWWTQDGWRERYFRFKQTFRNVAALVKMKQTLKHGFSKAQFIKTASDLYLQLHENYANGDISALKKSTTGSMHSKLKNELKKSQIQKYFWTFYEFQSAPKIRMIGTLKVPAMGQLHEYFQITVQFDSYQSIQKLPNAPEGLAKGLQTHEPTLFSCLARSPGQKVKVTDYYVFERYANDPNSEWRLASRVQESDKYYKLQG